MATVSITIPDVLIPRVTAAMRGSYPQYAALSDAAAFKRITGDLWVHLLAVYESSASAAASYAQSTTDAAGIG